MSKRQNGTGDWRSSPDAFLRAARGDHEASASDFARVEAELARRLAAAEAPTSQDVAKPAIGPKSAFTKASVTKLWIGLSLLAAGSFAVVRTLDLAHGRASRPADTAAPAPGPAFDAPAEVVAPAPAPEPRESPHAAGRARREPAVRVLPSRSSVAPRRPVPASSDASATQEPAGLHAQASAAGPTPSSSPVLEPPAARSGPPPRAAVALETEPAVQEAGASPRPQARQPGVSADARAELVLVERMQEAMRAGKPAAALALSAEHARRWPAGIFSEEREAVSAIASCALRTDDAASRAHLFLSRHPHAPTAPRVAAACAPPARGPVDAGK